ncbi:MAG: L-carnitine dehydrogenase [Acidimicrobiia bacterium]|nr:L-carnitine dehydrogenase [Acidimicrobiia bacterium]
MRFGVVGTGVIGAGWTTRALARGWDVVATDPAPAAEERLRLAVDRAWESARKLGVFPGADPTRLEFAASLEEVVSVSEFVQESVPEHESLKKGVHEAIDAVADPDVVVASSSSGLLPSHLQAGLRHPGRLVIGHPFNPVYLLPLVEVLGGSQTSESALERAIAVYEDLGMYPLRVRTEIEGYLSDRLQEAMWREILHLVNDGVATTGELDEAILYGPGLRWAGMGTNLIFHLAGGENGMRHMLEQFGPALELPWTKLVAPPLSDDLIDAMVEGTSLQAGDRSIADLERTRDDYLIAVMRGLKAHDVGAGRTLARWEERLHGVQQERWKTGDRIPNPLELYACPVEPEWVDYNRHMTESAYLLAAGWATDKLFRYIGIDDDYRAGGHSFYTVETHISYRKEVGADAALRFTTQVLEVHAKRFRFIHEMYADEDHVASIEQLLVHVDTSAGRSTPIRPGPAAVLAEIAEAHRDS